MRRCRDQKTSLAPAERYGLSTLDAKIAASALRADCGAPWSEDMEDRMVLDQRPHIGNPFRTPGRPSHPSLPAPPLPTPDDTGTRTLYLLGQRAAPGAGTH